MFRLQTHQNVKVLVGVAVVAKGGADGVEDDLHGVPVVWLGFRVCFFVG